MTKKELFRTLGSATREAVLNISKQITDKYAVICIRQAQKTLVMVKMREPIEGSLFYLGELLCSECTVEVEGKKGFAVITGDDFTKTTAAATIDAAINADIAEATKLKQQIIELEQKQQAERAVINAQIMKSKVNFAVMGE